MATHEWDLVNRTSLRVVALDKGQLVRDGERCFAMKVRTTGTFSVRHLNPYQKLLDECCIRGHCGHLSVYSGFFYTLNCQYKLHSS